MSRLSWKHTRRLRGRNLPVSSSTQHAPDNLVTRIELNQRRNRMNHPAKDHPRTQSDQLILNLMIANIIPRRALSNNFRRTVRSRLEHVSQPLTDPSPDSDLQQPMRSPRPHTLTAPSPPQCEHAQAADPDWHRTHSRNST